MKLRAGFLKINKIDKSLSRLTKGKKSEEREIERERQNSNKKTKEHIEKMIPEKCKRL